MSPGLVQMMRLWRDVLRGPVTFISLLIVLFIAGIALAAPYLGLPPPEVLGDELYAPPSAEHWMGTDNNGRDVLSRVIWGARLALFVAVGSAVLATLIGIVLGSVAGYFGGWLDAIMSRTFDVFLVIPAFFLVLLIAALFGSSITLIMIAIAITTWPRSARIMRSQVLSLKNRTYVQASLSAGASHSQVLMQHIIPNGLPPLVTDATLLMGLAVLTEAGLSFLGLGDQNTVSWGRMIFEGQRHLRLAPWISIFPGIAMLIMIAAFNLLGDGLNQILNPQLRPRKRAGRIVTGFADDVPLVAALEPAEDDLLAVRNLRMYYQLEGEWLKAVDGVTFGVPRGGSLGIVGESGCGKSSLGAALMQVLPTNARVVAGEVRFDGRTVLDVTSPAAAAFQSVRWTGMSMIFQSAMNALNPVLTVERQLREAYLLHSPDAGAAAARARIGELFDTVGIPRQRMSAYPHELSGGMRQRVMIALALLHNPALIIADEPTTALDVLIQDQILAEIDRLKEQLNLSMILISHDLGTVAESCERVAVMYAGEIVELAPTEEIFSNPRHPYTRSLIATLPNLFGPRRELVALPGEPFVPVGEMVGCRFAPRCPSAADICRSAAPASRIVGPGHQSACHFADDAERLSATRPLIGAAS